MSGKFALQGNLCCLRLVKTEMMDPTGNALTQLGNAKYLLLQWRKISMPLS